jgi:hypothetical protein
MAAIDTVVCREIAVGLAIRARASKHAAMAAQNVRPDDGICQQYHFADGATQLASAGIISSAAVAVVWNAPGP